MEFPFKHPRSLTDKVVEDLVPCGGKFIIRRDQYSETQGPGGVDTVVATRSGWPIKYLVPRTDSIPQTEGPEKIVWQRKR